MKRKVQIRKGQHDDLARAINEAVEAKLDERTKELLDQIEIRDTLVEELEMDLRVAKAKLERAMEHLNRINTERMLRKDSTPQGPVKKRGKGKEVKTWMK